MISSIIWALVVGLVVGALGRLIVPGKQNLSIVMTMVIGVLASLVAGILLGATAYNNDNGGIPWFSIIVGGILAALGIVAYGRLGSRRV